jgi:hypothetical protein
MGLRCSEASTIRCVGNYLPRRAKKQPMRRVSSNQDVGRAIEAVSTVSYFTGGPMSDLTYVRRYCTVRLNASFQTSHLCQEGSHMAGFVGTDVRSHAGSQGARYPALGSWLPICTWIPSDGKPGRRYCGCRPWQNVVSFVTYCTRQLEDDATTRTHSGSAGTKTMASVAGGPSLIATLFLNWSVVG